MKYRKMKSGTSLHHMHAIGHPGENEVGESLDLNVSPLSALGQCNLDKEGIRKIEEGRRSASQ